MKKFLPVILIAIGFLLPVMNYAQVTECPRDRNGCTDAELMCATTVDFENPEPVGGPGPFPGCSSNVIDNQFWWRFIPLTANITVNITSANCRMGGGIQAGIYDDCANLNSTLVSPQCGCTTGPITFAVGGLTIGQEYYIMVDGCAGDVCDVTINIVDGMIDTDGGGGGGPGATPPAPYGDPLIVCDGDVGIYNFEPQGGGTYIWLLDGGQVSTGNIDDASCMDNGNGVEGMVQITWSNPGITPSDDCFNLTYEYIPSGVCGGPGQSVESDPLQICFDDPSEEVQGFFCSRENTDGFFYTGDNLTYFDGVYNTVIRDPGECPVYVELEVTSFFALDSILFYAVCPGDSVEIEGEFYRAPQNGSEIIIEEFYDRDPNGEIYCDKYIQLTMVELNPSVSIVPVGDSVINCINTEVTLSAVANPNDVDYVWTTPNGSITPVTDDTIRATSAGTYIVTVELEGFGTSCYASDTIIIAEDINAPSASASKTDILCGGDTNGTATATGSGGVPPYTYLWSNSATTSAITGLGAGSYTVSITGANGCIDSATVNIIEPNPIVLTTSAQPAVCNGGNTGTASVSSMGGTGAYTYAWSTAPVQATATATGLSAGTYTVTVTDENGCSRTETAVVTEPTALVTTITSIPAGCAGGADGSATVSPSGGVGAFSYQWSTAPVQTTATATGLTAGTYTVTVTDGNNCTTTNSISVGEATPITLTAAKTDALCDAGSDGSATVSPMGGTGAYTYAWSTAPVQTTATATGLTAGTYTVTVTDVNGCSETIQVTIDDPTAIVLNLSGINPRCNTSADGSVTVAASGGTGAYTYAWSTIPVQTTPTASLIPGGTYTVTVTDANGCSIQDQFTINPPNALTASLDNTTDASCNNGNDGSATISGNGGTTPYTYQWPVSAGGQMTATANNLQEGTYVPTITDANGCTETVTVVIIEPTPISVAATVDGHVLCNAGTDGSASAAGNGGTGAYTYTWSSGTPSGATVANLPAGTHTVTVSDANGCTSTDQVTITEPPVLVINSSSFTNPLCNSANDGTATVDVVGGTPGYTYAWTGSTSTSATANDLVDGSASVTVTDLNGCSVIQNFTLTEPNAVVASIDNTTDVLCSYSQDGTASASGSGGTPPYTYTWSGGTPSGSSVSDLPVGSISVVVTDMNGCSGTATATIDAPPALDLQMSQIDALCKGESNGSARVVVSGGTMPYTYNWSNGQFSEDATLIPAGLHTVTVTDGNGCTAENNISVGEPADALSMSGTSTDATCGEANGCVDVTPAGGTPPYTYNWPNDGDTRQNRCDLAPGTYSPVVTDANGCTFSVQVIVSTANQFQINAITAVDVLCNGDSDGAVNVDVSGGVTPYTFAWSDGTTVTQNIANIPVGNYTITVTDNTGCTLVADAVVDQPDPLGTTAQVVDSDCGQSTGSVSVSPSGGITPYTYAWSGSSNTTATLGNVPLGDYTVTITDANGCTFVETQSVGNPNSPEISSITGDDLGCFEDNSGVIEVVVTNGTAPYTYDWVQSEPIGANPSGLPAGTYTVMVTDSRSCETMASVTISEPDVLSIQSITAIPALCGQDNGCIDVTPTGGTPPYTYVWAGLTNTTNNPCNLPPGNFVVDITDANGCTIQASESTVPPGAVSVDAVVTNALCFEGDDGNIDVTLSGGQGPFTFNWNYQSATTEDLSSLPEGTYILTVTDGTGCTYVNQYSVTDPDEIEAVSVAQDATCGNNDGNISLGVSGGVQPYTYAWSDGATTDQNITNLLPGNYTVTITDANGCVLIHNADPVELPDGPTVSFASVTNAQCFNATDGEVVLDVTGGTEPYTFQWSDINSSGMSSDQLGAGPVSITITDAKNCELIVDTVITHPDELLRDQVAINQATCGNPNGSINLTMMGGTTPYTYDWSPALTNSPDQTGLAAGPYRLIVTDAQGCTYEEVFDVSAPGELTAQEQRKVNVSCNGGSDGEFEVIASGGTSPYTYSWSVPGVGDVVVATGLPAGNVTVTVSDANGCNIEVNGLIGQPEILAVAQTGGTDATCNQANGSIEVAGNGGTSPYTYDWPSPIPQGPSPDNLPAGSYIVTISDANGCTMEETFTVDQPGQPTYALRTDSVNCNGEANGSVFLDISAGLPPFTYQWSDNQATTSQDLTMIPAGGYTVTITDAVGCTYTAQASVGQPDEIRIDNAAALDANCNGGNSGSLAIVVVGGTSPFSYAWSNGDVTDNPTSLLAGNYQVTITDRNGCSLTSSYNISEPEALAVTLATNDANCNASADGSITSSVTGGTGTYTYLWSNQATTEDANGLAAGPYGLTVTDANGCTIEASETVGEPGEIQVLVTDISQYGIYNVSCNDSDDGSVTVSAQGSVAPYTYLWNNGETTASIDGIRPGTYEVQITDGNGCTKTEAVTLISPEPLTPAIQSIDPTCFGYSNGLIFLESVSGGTAPFVYSMDGQPFTPRPDFRNLSTGSYEVVVQDANGCEWIDAVTLQEPNPLVVDLGDDITIEYGDQAIISTFYNHPVSEYEWTSAYLPCTTTPDSCALPLDELVVSPPETSDYILYFLDENNCSETVSVRVHVEKPRRVYIPNVFSPNSDNSENKIFTVFTGRGVEMINKFEIFNRWGEVVHSLPEPIGAQVGTVNVEAGWDGTFHGEPMNPGVFVYYAEILFADGHVEVYTGDVTLVR